MNTVNIILMVLLSAMIGFAIGNAWGKESMKRMFAQLIDGLIKGTNAPIGKSESTRKGE